MTVIAVPFHLDEHLADLALPVTADRTLTPDLPAGTPWERMAELYEQVAAAVAEEAGAGRVPIVVSGDCTTSLGVVAGLQRAGSAPSLVWFDAHGDVQSPETSASGYLGGFPIRQLAGGADRTVAERIGLQPVAQEDIVLVDGRDLDPPEADYLAASAIKHVAVGAIPVPAGPLYLHLDCDVIDPQDLPGLLFPVPGGPRLGTVAEAVRGVVAAGSVAAIGIACTWKVGSGAEQVVAALVGELATSE
ncbi:arginase family protein [Pseudonocardia sp. GCM10023141]|uniref:arginase family protein n=1 Tax=Pseudonocardia sp. GCM10023141 TaxID=3252653 RepID=UPI003605C96E